MARPKKAAPKATEQKQTMTADGAVLVEIPTIKITSCEMKVVGTSSLIVHAWSEKAKKEMRDKQMGVARGPRDKKDPQADFESSKYKDAAGQDCFPSIAFKTAIVDAASFLSKDVTKVLLRGAVFILGDLVPIKYKECVMREDMVRVGMGTADIRYRAEYRDWSAILPIQFNSSVINAAQVASLLNHAGFAIGVGEWRPQKDGQFGRFEVR
jgi:hypothetical protein